MKFRIPKPLLEQLNQCHGSDKALIYRKLRKQAQLKQQNKPHEKLATQIDELMQVSMQRVANLAATPISVKYPQGLPVSEQAQKIGDLIESSQVVVVAGETGSGKTTQIPKICLERGYGSRARIGHTQPRRIAARTVASRIADELEQSLGETIGYQVRFTDHSTDNTRVKLMTDGILLAEIQQDPLLRQYEVLIIDEAHERSLNIDFLLGFLRQLLPKRPDLKVIITSATIDVERFSSHFGDAPIIEVSGRTYPVETVYQPLMRESSDEADLSMNQGVIDAVESIFNWEKKGETHAKGGDILVFLAGEREIRELHKDLKKQQWSSTEILPLYARLSIAEQNKVFSQGRGRRIVLATNVAETSLTVPGIHYVIDPGTARISRYSYRTKIQRLPIEPISQASANQRAGRCGRIAPGICIRLYGEEDFQTRPEFTEPEILRTNLAAVILQMLRLKLGDIKQFPFVEPPDNRMVNDGFKLLEELQAVDKQGKVQNIGYDLGRLQVDPKLGRMLVEANRLNCLAEVLIVVSALAIQDPRERPADKQAQADQAHAPFKDRASDFASFIRLWSVYEANREEMSQSQLRKWAKRNFLSFVRLREWRELHFQLVTSCKQLGWKVPAYKLTQFDSAEVATLSSDNYEKVHKAILSGLLGNLGQFQEQREYLGARGKRFEIFPGSGAKRSKPKWLVAGSLIETSKLFAHQIAVIQPEWVELLAQHLIKRNYSEPHWEQRAGRVAAYERVTLYGLPIVEKRKVHYGPIDETVSREIFIRECLVAQLYKGKGKFQNQNKALIASIEGQESKIRRRDILVDEDRMFEFFSARIPSGIHNLKSFEHWRKGAEMESPKLLEMTRDDLVMRDVSLGEDQFPNQISVSGLILPLSYSFEPGKEYDGVTLKVPLSVLNQLDEQPLHWLVPGMLREKVIALVKGLPKAMRKQLVPVPDAVDRLLANIGDRDQDLFAALSKQVLREYGLKIDPITWQQIELENYYQMIIAITDERGKIIARDRNLAPLKEKLGSKIREAIADMSDSSLEQEGLTSWSFGKLKQTHRIKRSGLQVEAFPALIDNHESIDLKLLDNAKEAHFENERGVSRIVLLSMSDRLKSLSKRLLADNKSKLQHADFVKRDDLIDDIFLAAMHHTIGERTIDTREALEQFINQHFGLFHDNVVSLGALVANIIQARHRVMSRIRKAKNFTWTFAVSDIQKQVNALVFKGFVYYTPIEYLQQFERYFDGIDQRLDKLQGGVDRDRRAIADVEEALAPLTDKFGEPPFTKALVLNSDYIEYRWLIEELRISLFSQPMKTTQPVSVKRLRKHWQALED